MATVRVGSKERPFDVLIVNEGGDLYDGVVITVEYIQLSHVAGRIRRLDCNAPGCSWRTLYNELVHRYTSCAKPERNQKVDPTSYVSVVYFVRK